MTFQSASSALSRAASGVNRLCFCVVAEIAGPKGSAFARRMSLRRSRLRQMLRRLVAAAWAPRLCGPAIWRFIALFVLLSSFDFHYLVATGPMMSLATHFKELSSLRTA